jgi:lipopolysaccharide/colanic/teichoic acid biosynthesis glycosyltransferase
VSTIDIALVNPAMTMQSPIVPDTMTDLTGIDTETVFFKLNQVIKRLFDISASSLGILFISPILLIIAVAIAASSQGPVIYTSTRIGKDRKPFRMFKFRTMITNADALRDKLRKEANLNGELFKIKNDPRITPVGHLLRATSLDELPQLFNVFLGNMSLIGPRPLPQDESDLFENPYTVRFKVLPGITGAWQISGRSSLTFKQLCQLELNYVRGWHFFRDLNILFKTIPVVLFRKGAY